MNELNVFTGMKQAEVLQSAATKVQKMSLDGAKQQGQGLAKLMESAKVITDPALGNIIDVKA
jgi:hypothetical protein